MFSQHTPKYAFITWLSMKDRLSTLDRVAKWSQGVDTKCVLCKGATETRSHLFFDCGYTSQIWEYIAKGIMGNTYTKTWDDILLIIQDERREKLSRFCIRYAFQTVLYAVWRERNKVLHGEKLSPLSAIKKMVDKGIRTKITLMRRDGVKGMEKLMQFWFSTKM